MKKLLLLVPCLCFIVKLNAQTKPAFFPKPRITLTDISKSILAAQANLQLYGQNQNDHSQEHDVNTIILDIEKYIDSMPKNRSSSDALLMKEFNPLRHFFLTTTNKTTVATSFLYSGTPYQFCAYHDTAVALHIYAVKDGDIYNLSKITEKKAVLSALQSCLLPSLKALDEFNDNEIKYVGISVYYGCKDTREGAPKEGLARYCLTLVARLTDIQQHAAGLITDKGLLAASELYINDADDTSILRKIQVNID